MSRPGEGWKGALPRSSGSCGRATRRREQGLAAGSDSDTAAKTTPCSIRYYSGVICSRRPPGWRPGGCRLIRTESPGSRASARRSRSAPRPFSTNATPRSKAIGRAKARGEDIEPLPRGCGAARRRAEGPGRPGLRSSRPRSRGISLEIPNLTHDTVPEGRDEDDNREERRGRGAAALRLRAEGPHRPRRRARRARLRAGVEARREPVRHLERGVRAPAPRAHPVHARGTHPRARLPGDLHPVSRLVRRAARHRTDSEVRRRPCSGSTSTTCT